MDARFPTKIGRETELGVRKTKTKDSTTDDHDHPTPPHQNFKMLGLQRKSVPSPYSVRQI